MSALPTLITVMSMLFVPIHMDRTLAHVKLDFQEMDKVALVSYLNLFCKTTIIAYFLTGNKNREKTSVEGVKTHVYKHL